ncbi:MAG: hypothetical protein R3C39_07785 [Dehalococcoidia bacterium]
MAEYRFVREARTPQSESYAIEDAEHALGRVDLHFTSSATFATLAVHEAIDDDAVQELIAEIDDRLVMSADPYREDLIVTVWRGVEVGVFADDASDEDDDDGDFDDEDDDLDDDDEDED